MIHKHHAADPHALYIQRNNEAKGKDHSQIIKHSGRQTQLIKGSSLSAT